MFRFRIGLSFFVFPPSNPLVSSFYVFDAQNLAWCVIPSMPCNPHVYGLCNFVTVSCGSSVYVVGGSVFDTRTFPPGRPSGSSSVVRFDFVTGRWETVSDMITLRGSFACAVDANSGNILVAGGGSGHVLFRLGGSCVSSVEMYDIARNEWVGLDGLPGLREGCVGFMVGNEFWVMGGYGELCYKNAVVLQLKNGEVGKWRELGDMWEEGERWQLGRIAVVEDFNGGFPGVFMLDYNTIFRYDMTSNRWWKETTLPKRALDESSVGFIALNGELHVIATHNGNGSIENRSLRRHMKSTTLFLQIYHPGKRVWRTLITKPPVEKAFDFKTAVMCTIRFKLDCML